MRIQGGTVRIEELLTLIDGTRLTPDTLAPRDITCGYSCDLLSWVMAHGRAGMAWVTVQTHMNVVAVASLADMACVILPEGITMDGAPLQKAQDEGIAVITSPLSAYAICGRMAAKGVPA